MTYGKTYTLSEIAAKLGKARTTVAEWGNLFREYLPTIGKGRTMRYKEEAWELFAMIARMKEANEPNDYIRDRLRGAAAEIVIDAEDGEKTPVFMEISQTTTHLLERIDELTEKNERFAEQHERMAQAMEMMAKKMDELVAQKTNDEVAASQEIQGVEAKIDRLTSKLDEMTTSVSQIEASTKKSVWSRLFGR